MQSAQTRIILPRRSDLASKGQAPRRRSQPVRAPLTLKAATPVHRPPDPRTPDTPQRYLSSSLSLSPR